MKLVTFIRGQLAHVAHAMRYGAQLGDAILDLQYAAALADEALDAPCLTTFIAGGEPALAIARRLAARAEARDPLLNEALVPSRAARLLAPIPRPSKNVFRVGRNDAEHVVEGAAARGFELKWPDVPQFFSNPPTAVIGPDGVFHHDPEVTQKLDDEVELAVIIGAGDCDTPRHRILQHVFVYTIVNDLTARALQRRHEQWLTGKGLDRSCPMGPWIITADEISNPGALELALTVNGEERQRAHLANNDFQCSRRDRLSLLGPHPGARRRDRRRHADRPGLCHESAAISGRGRHRDVQHFQHWIFDHAHRVVATEGYEI